MSDDKALTVHGKADLSFLQEARQNILDQKAARQKAKMKLVVGRNLVRILPPWGPHIRSPFYETYVHYLPNPNDPAKKTATVCPRKTRASKLCASCDKASELYRSQGQASKTAGDFTAGHRILANVIDLQNPALGVLVAEYAPGIYGDILTLMLGSGPDDDTALGDISHPDRGYNMVIDREGTGKTDTRYKVRFSKAPSPIADRSWLGALNDLSTVYPRRTPDEIAAILAGEDPDAPPPGVIDVDATPVKSGGGIDDDDF
jgi:hypothetical protein